MTIVITADGEIDYHVTIINFDSSVEYYLVNEETIDKFLEDIRK